MVSNATEKIAYDFLVAKIILQEIEFELIGKIYINEDKYFIVKKKEKKSYN